MPIPKKHPRKNPTTYDTKYIDAIEDLKEKEDKQIESMEPSEIASIDLRLREGSEYNGDTMMFAGKEIKIPQLSFIEVRKANREGLKIFDKTDIGKRILNGNRASISNEEFNSLFSFSDIQCMKDMTDVEDLWLMFFALNKIKYPGMNNDFEKDKDVILSISRFDVESFIQNLRRVNGLPVDGLPSGEDAMSSFRNINNG